MKRWKGRTGRLGLKIPGPAGRGLSIFYNCIGNWIFITVCGGGWANCKGIIKNGKVFPPAPVFLNRADMFGNMENLKFLLNVSGFSIYGNHDFWT